MEGLAAGVTRGFVHRELADEPEGAEHLGHLHGPFRRIGSSGSPIMVARKANGRRLCEVGSTSAELVKTMPPTQVGPFGAGIFVGHLELPDQVSHVAKGGPPRARRHRRRASTRPSRATACA
jgi:hypothetical protein